VCIFSKKSLNIEIFCLCWLSKENECCGGPRCVYSQKSVYLVAFIVDILNPVNCDFYYNILGH
jgi:hypothetical protein